MDLRIPQVESECLDGDCARRSGLQEGPGEGEEGSVIDDVIGEGLGHAERTAVLAGEDIGCQIVHVDAVSAPYGSGPKRTRPPGEAHARLEVIAIVVAQGTARKAGLLRRG